MIFAILLLLTAVLYRVVLGCFGGADCWLPNFAPVAAIALCAPRLFPRRAALVLPLAILLVSDLVLNWHYGAAFVSLEMLVRYAVLLGIAGLGLRLAGSSRMLPYLGASLAGSTLFYVVTNSVSWLSAPGYAKSVAGWWQALTVGLPGYPPTWLFFRNTLVSDLVFTLLFAACIVLSQAKSHARPAVDPVRA